MSRINRLTTGARRIAAATGLAIGLLVAAAPSQANTVSSNQPDCSGTGVRVFTVTANTVIKCLAKGAGNINGNGDAINQLGYTLLDKSDQGGDLLEGALSSLSGLNTGAGSFSILASAYSAYSNFVIGFKSGQGQVDPDWAAFLLADNTLTGTWSISQQGLSHVNLYGIKKSGGGSGVPEPASLLLLGAALLGLVTARRRLG